MLVNMDTLKVAYHRYIGSTNPVIPFVAWVKCFESPEVAARWLAALPRW